MQQPLVFALTHPTIQAFVRINSIASLEPSTNRETGLKESETVRSVAQNSMPEVVGQSLLRRNRRRVTIRSRSKRKGTGIRHAECIGQVLHCSPCPLRVDTRATGPYQVRGPVRMVRLCEETRLASPTAGPCTSPRSSTSPLPPAAPGQPVTALAASCASNVRLCCRRATCHASW